jgi:putative membrane protein
VQTNRSAPSGLVASARRPVVSLNQLALWLFSVLALLSYLLVFWTLLGIGTLPGKPGGPEAVLVLTTLFATLAALARHLPAQNVALAAVIIGFIGGLAHGVGAATGIPFGPFSYTDSAGPRFFNTLSWALPALWVIVILNARGVARLILRPWRKLRNYGFWLIGLTAALALLFDVALEPFAARVKHFWLWQPTKLPFSWYGVPVVNFPGWLLTALLILAFATPALINKQQRQKSPPDYHPLVVWLLTFALFAAGAITQRLWPAVGFCVVSGVVTAVFALRGARW